MVEQKYVFLITRLRMSRRKTGRRETFLNLRKSLGIHQVLAWSGSFLLTLRDSGVGFVACDMPEANDLTVGIMALVAQQEREAISRRTKEALEAAKARGVSLGNPNGAAALRRAGEDGLALRAAVAQNADEFALALRPVVDAIRNEEHIILRAIARELNRRGIATRRGGQWQVSNTRDLITRLSRLKAKMIDA